MKIGYAFIPSFIVEAERLRQPDLAGRPLVVGGLPHERRSVLAASAEARAAGVALGLTLRQAQYLCPEAAFLPFDRTYCDQLQTRLLASLEELSPAVEPDGWGAAYLDADGLEMLYQGDGGFCQRIQSRVRESLGLAARVALAPNRLVVRIAAHSAKASRHIIVGPGEEYDFLRHLPSRLLPLSEETQERLRRLGISTIGDFLRLPQPVLGERLGADALSVHRAAGGDPHEQVQPRPEPREIRRTTVPDFPLLRPEDLKLLVQSTMGEMAGQLGQRGQVCRQVGLRLGYEGGQVAETRTLFKEAPTERGLARTAGYLVERLCPTSPGVETEAGLEIEEIEVILGQIEGEQGRQLPLLQTRLEQQRRRERLEQALAHLRQRFGNNFQYN